MCEKETERDRERERKGERGLLVGKHKINQDRLRPEGEIYATSGPFTYSVIFF